MPMRSMNWQNERYIDGSHHLRVVFVTEKDDNNRGNSIYITVLFRDLAINKA